ncbi:hypothetical protein PR048_011861 [Dryococelus australis]|uniref:Uncharacterized protein n=1 Tax=Dryococelus australis TaxID=614101 RepID=A0ABQ9HMU7_9NEOP|nr:hypothetical protein PR048_011861 [Dryococelus australis]
MDRAQARGDPTPCEVEAVISAPLTCAAFISETAAAVFAVVPDLSNAESHRLEMYGPKASLGEHRNPNRVVEQHTSLTTGIMVWRVIGFDSRSALILLPGRLTAHLNADEILRPCLLTFFWPGHQVRYSSRIPPDRTHNGSPIGLPPSYPTASVACPLSRRVPNRDNILRLLYVIPECDAACIALLAGAMHYLRLPDGIPQIHCSVLVIMCINLLYDWLYEDGAILDCKGGGKGVPRENPPASGIVQHDSHIRKSGNELAGDRTLIGLGGGGECANRCATAAPGSPRGRGEFSRLLFIKGKETAFSTLLDNRFIPERNFLHASSISTRKRHRSDEALVMRVSVARIAPSLPKVESELQTTPFKVSRRWKDMSSYCLCSTARDIHGNSSAAPAESIAAVCTVNHWQKKTRKVTQPFVLREYVYDDEFGRLDVNFKFSVPLNSIIWGFMGITGSLLRCSIQPARRHAPNDGITGWDPWVPIIPGHDMKCRPRLEMCWNERAGEMGAPPIKTAGKRHRPSRFPRANTREWIHRESNLDRRGGTQAPRPLRHRSFEGELKQGFKNMAVSLTVLYMLTLMHVSRNFVRGRTACA